MKLNSISLVFIFLIILGCRQYVPFLSRADKNKAINSVKESLNLDKNEWHLLKQRDTVLFELSKSIEKNISIQLIERRLDSFLMEKYSLIEFTQMMQFERELGGEHNIEYFRDYKQGNPILNIESPKDLNKTLDSIENLLNTGFRNKTKNSKNDSIP